MNRENPQLEEAIRSLHQQMEDDPTSEKPLDALIQVELALRSILEIKELSKETKAEIDRVLMGLTGRTISLFLDEIHERAFRVMKSNSAEVKEDIEGYLAKLKIIYRKVEKVILIPDERNGIVAGSGKGFEKKEIHTNKLQHLLELLRANEIYTDDICIVIGENTPNMMREGSYLYIEIPKVKRTILLHLGYGEASFVLYDIYDRAIVFEMTKERIQLELGATKVEYTERDLNKWGGDMLNALKLNVAVQVSKIDIKNYDKRLFYIEEIKKLYPTPEKFMELTQKQKLKLKIHGKGLKTITTKITGQKGLYPAGRTKDMAILGKEIYGEGHDCIEEALKEDETKEWTKEKWIEEIKKLYPTSEKFMELTQKQKLKLKIQGKGLTFFTTQIIGRVGLSPVTITKDMLMLAKVIYGVLYKSETADWTKEKWIEEIKKLYPTSEEFMELTQKQKSELKINGKGLYKIATKIIGQAGLDPVNSMKDLVILGKEIYGEGHDCIEEALKEDETKEWTKEKWIEEIKKLYPTSEEFMELIQKQKYKLKIQGKGLKLLATKITGKTGLRPECKTKDMAMLAKEIYGDGHDCIEEELKEDETEGWAKEKWIEEVKKLYPTPEEFMELTNKQKLELKIQGKGLKLLATKITGQTSLVPTSRTKDQLVLAKEIYGELYEFETADWTKEKWIEEIKKLHPTPEKFMELTQKQKLKLKIHGKGLKTITTKITGQKGLHPTKKTKDMAILAKEIYGEGHKSIEDALKEVNTEEWTKEKWIEEIKKLYPTPEEFIGLTIKQRSELKIHGKGLITIATKITKQAGLDPSHRIKDTAILAKEIYGVGDKLIECEEWTKKEWIEEIKKLYPTPEEFMGLNVNQKKELKICGKGFRLLATKITGQAGLKPVGVTKDIAILAKEIYGEGHKCIEEALKEDVTEEWTKKEWIEEIKKLYPTPEEFMGLNVNQKRELKIQGKGLTTLATKITGIGGFKVLQRTKDIAILAKEIYGEGHKCIEEALMDDETEEWTKEKWIEEILKIYPTVEEFMGLVFKQKKELKIHGKSLKTLATKITEQTGLDPIGRKNDMAILADAIYGPNNSEPDNQ